MRTILISALLAVIGMETVWAQWCGLPSCRGQHIDCILGEAGSWGEACPENKTMLDLRSVQGIILDRHNSYRNKLAGGQMAGFPQACRMGTMVWNITLANLARKNVRQCAMKHDGCRNTPEYDYAGQNLAYYKYPMTTNVKNIDVIMNLVDAWWNEYKVATVEDINPIHPVQVVIGHFAQMAKDYATRVGCAAMKATAGDDVTLFFACNYDIGNINGYPTYVEGPAVSKCTTGKNTDYSNLCSTNEVYNINKFWEDFQ